MSKISIIIITKNSAETISACLEKIISQTYKNIELLILDSDSTDETLSIAKNQLANYSNVQFENFKNLSLAAIRAMGIKKATGEYILFVLPTDILNIYACEMLYAYASTYHADLVVGSFVHPYYKNYLSFFSYNLSIPEHLNQYKELFLVHPFLSGKLYKKELLKKIVFPDFILSEQLININYLDYANQIVTMDKVIIHTYEHYNLLNSDHFWKSKSSFWFQSFPSVLKMTSNRFILAEIQFVASAEHLLFEIISYIQQEATLEEITMEMFSLMDSKEFKEGLKRFSYKGLEWKSKNKEALLTNCLLISDFFYSYRSIPSHLSLFKLFLLSFIKIFFTQKNSLDTKEYIGLLKEDLNLNHSKEAQYINKHI